MNIRTEKNIGFPEHCAMPSNALPLHLKQTFLPIIWIFTEGDGIKSRLPFKKFSTLMVQETRSKRISPSCMWCGNGKCKSAIFNISWGRKSFWSWLLWSGRLRAGYSRLQIEPLKVGRDATYFTFDLTQHSVRRFTPLVSAWHYNSVYDMAEKTFCF